jgi:gliding motility-associated-like protein
MKNPSSTSLKKQLMRLRSLFFFVTLFSTVSLFAQDSWHRNYALTGGDTIQVSGGAISGGGAHYNVGAYVKEGLIEALQVNGFNAKGDVQWSRLIYSADSIPFASLGSMAYDDNKLYVSASVNGQEENKALFVLDNRGNSIYTKYYTNGENDIPADVRVKSFLGNNMLLGTSNLVGGEVRASLSRIDHENGDVLWNRSFGNFNDNGNIPADILNIDFFQDSTISVVGQTITESGQSVIPYVARFDTLGVETWSKSYEITSANPYQLGYFNSAYLSDSTTVAVGRLLDQDPNPQNLRFNGIVSHLDSIGDEIWTKEVIFPGLTVTVLYDVVVTPNGNMNVYGETADLVLGEGFGFTLTLDQEGNQVQLIAYDESPVLVPFGPSIEMVATPDNGAAIFTSTLDNQTVLPAIVKVNESMNTPCDSLLETEVLFDLKLTVNDIEWVVDDVVNGLDSISTNNPYGGISVPTLALNDTTYCPQDPIMKTYDAFQEEATEYLWSTGETTPQITVTEEGMYLVTVTMGEDVCYTLCDTVTVDKYNFPSVSINRFDGNYCTTRQIELSMVYNDGAPFQTDSVVWSTGERGLGISINAVGTYGVTVTDDCGNSDAAEVVIDELPDITGQIRIDTIPDLECTKTLTAVYVPNTELGEGEVEYLWSTGEQISTIMVDSSTTYRVTVVNVCNDTLVTETDIDVDKNKAITFDTIQTGECLDRKVTIIPDYPFKLNLEYEWSFNGDTLPQITDTIQVREPGTYSLKITNACDTFDIAEYVLPSLNESLDWPYVFFPAGQEEQNRTFGPIITCPELLDNYELHIYNRWGNEVFESNDPEVEWNGRHNDENAPSAIYVYWARYTINGEEFTDKGDINLLR